MNPVQTVIVPSVTILLVLPSMNQRRKVKPAGALCVKRTVATPNLAIVMCILFRIRLVGFQ
jgi:hypothetical protein